LRLIDVSAHRLVPGQVIRLHNDYIEDAETHRFLIQLNRGWQATQGGLLMLFAEEDASSLQHVILPIHASGFAFEISPSSFHAVSKVKRGERYTLVYTFGLRGHCSKRSSGKPKAGDSED
jgi:Rps23 Pro-64 3,4-dihydroxylase Tpa1-like proline 4-hydroxylase